MYAAVISRINQAGMMRKRIALAVLKHKPPSLSHKFVSQNQIGQICQTAHGIWRISKHYVISLFANSNEPEHIHSNHMQFSHVPVMTYLSYKLIGTVVGVHHVNIQATSGGKFQPNATRATKEIGYLQFIESKMIG